jgi:hypothetical protein
MPNHKSASSMKNKNSNHPTKVPAGPNSKPRTPSHDENDNMRRRKAGEDPNSKRLSSQGEKYKNGPSIHNKYKPLYQSAATDKNGGKELNSSNQRSSSLKIK